MAAAAAAGAAAEAVSRGQGGLGAAAGRRARGSPQGAPGREGGPAPSGTPSRERARSAGLGGPGPREKPLPWFPESPSQAASEAFLPGLSHTLTIDPACLSQTPPWRTVPSAPKSPSETP